MRQTIFAFAFGALFGCSFTLGLEGNSNRPCPDNKCLDGYTCFHGTCLPVAGSACTKGNECPSGVCRDGGCALPPCADALKDFRETDVDCGGGFCSRCDAGLSCKAGTDCVDNVCDGGHCQEASCADGVQNGHETDVDCGGDGGCPPCGQGFGCRVNSDCVAGTCVGVCQPATCGDNSKDGLETDVDCGGPCQKCDDGKGCGVGADCKSGVCSMVASPPTCAVPTCSDSVKNGGETDVDCGGTSNCQRCADGLVCGGGGDCLNGVCQNASCRPAHCGNGTKDVDESDKDCGGPCQKCGLADNCNHDSDCNSNNCWSGYCIP